jgi:WD40 repeat protein
MRKFLLFFTFFSFLSACAPKPEGLKTLPENVSPLPSNTKTKPPTSTITLFPSPTFTPTHTYTPLPPTLTPTPSLDMILEEVSPLCEAAYLSEVEEGTVQKPVLAVIHRPNDDWETYRLPFVEAITTTEVKSIICINQKGSKVGTYIPSGIDAIRIDWDIRVISWPNGDIVAKTYLRGSHPPRIASRATTGGTPKQSFNKWLFEDLGLGNIDGFFHHYNSVREIALSPDGKTLAVGFTDVDHIYTGEVKSKSVVLWDLQTAQQLYTIDSMWASSFAFSPNSNILAVGTDEGLIHLWDIKKSTLVGSLTRHQYGVKKLAFSPAGDFLVSEALDSVLVWDMQTGEVVQSFDNGSHFSLSPDGKILAMSTSDTPVIFDLNSGEELYSLSAQKNDILVLTNAEVLAFSPDGKILVTINDKFMRFWDVETGQDIGILMVSAGNPKIAFSPDGKVLAVGRGDGHVYLFDVYTAISKMPKTDSLDDWEELTEESHFDTLFGHVGGITGLTFSPSGKLLISASFGGVVKIWKLTE